MKRLLIPLAAAGLSAALLAQPSSAAPDWVTDNLMPKPADAYSTAKFWLGANGAALRKATQYNWDAKNVSKLVATQSKDGAPDGKPGLTAPTGTPKPTASKNVNLPKTIGKVFFVDHAGRYRWCSATSIQARNRNLVATAGHCVYETGKDVYAKWIFVPGYYQGKAPWGVYVGAYAFTSYDLDTYDDYDGDFAFVAVHNGFSLVAEQAEGKQVLKSEFDKFDGKKDVKSTELKDIPGGKTAEQQYKEGLDKYGPNGGFRADNVTSKDAAGGNFEDSVPTVDEVEVTEGQYAAAPAANENPALWKNGDKGATKNTALTEAQYKQKLDEKAQGKVLGKVWKDNLGDYWLTQYYVVQWYKVSSSTKYFHDAYFIFPDNAKAKDMGRLGDVVGGQGFAWNQPRGQKVTVFGYPAAPHPDGDKPYTGVTPKWCSGTTGTKTYQVNTFRVEEHQVLKCSMTPGADGGPWLMKYDNGKRTGYVNGVTSMFHDQDGNDRIDFISSAYFDGEVADVYNKANYAETKSIVGPNGELLD
ncbi:trypsin-like serine peptidase [Nonomuraea sp. NPDC049655]|uniref:trypsin-like serine peptidase n=1 Tax=Nonomuraea sp. NPDC049655 TaxID=3364355 RepID=UPI00378E66AF